MATDFFCIGFGLFQNIPRYTVYEHHTPRRRFDNIVPDLQSIAAAAFAHRRLRCGPAHSIDVNSGFFLSFYHQKILKTCFTSTLSIIGSTSDDAYATPHRMYKYYSATTVCIPCSFLSGRTSLGDRMRRTILHHPVAMGSSTPGLSERFYN